ncbi:methyltransferase domain-containing protein [Opitutales bacterium ASA1]|uniref:class I SAM-dependent methyltransferase n=1 Tax=Congregicoccus parvus TaxID=3081749 RepID=UPI002B2EA9A2|nr:methyltransferase domain-containing protein [Opitutales bacterium ASA1]
MSARIQAIVERLGVGPDETILEVGCGHGVAVDIICRRLVGGRLVAIDRSAKMIEAARRRNAAHEAAGLVGFHVASLETFDPGAQRFDAVLAIRVGLFHREPRRARMLVEPWLKPGGRIVAEFDEP